MNNDRKTPRILRGVTRTVRMTILDATGDAVNLSLARKVVATISLDGGGKSNTYTPGITIGGEHNNVVSFVWYADMQQRTGRYTIELVADYGDRNQARVNWHRQTGIELVEYNVDEAGSLPETLELESYIDLTGSVNMNGVGMSAYEQWLSSDYSEGYEKTVGGFMAWLQRPAKDAEDHVIEELGSKEGSEAGDGTMWGEYKTAEEARDEARQTAEGTGESEAGDGSRWGAYKTAEEARDEARRTAEGTGESEAGDGSRWGAYKTAEEARDEARQTAEGTDESEAGDGTRWGAFKTAEAERKVVSDAAAKRANDAAAAAERMVDIKTGPKGDKGDQGNSGYSGAAGELEVVNNLSEGGATKALSAEQGKTLDGKISQLGQELDGGLAEYSDSTFSQGGISTSNGNNSSSTSQIRTDYIITDKIRVNITNGYVYFYGYNESDYISATGWKTGDNTIEITGATKYRLAFKKLDGSTLSPTDFSNLGATIYKIAPGIVLKTTEQSFNDVEKQQARLNIKAASSDDATTLFNGLSDTNAKIGILVYRKYWKNSSSSYADGECYIIPVSGQSKVYFKGNGTSNTEFAFLDSYDISTDSFVLVSGSSVTTISSSADSSKDIPVGTNYIYILTKVGSTDRKPGEFYIDGGIDISQPIIMGTGLISRRLGTAETSIAKYERVYAYARPRMVYLNFPQSKFSGNSVYIHTIYVISDSVNQNTKVLQQEYSFSENGYLLLDASDLTNMSVTKVSSLSGTPYNAIVLLRYVDGYGFTGGALFNQYMAHFRTSLNYIRETPKSPAVLNVYKKAKQFQLVPWTPKLTVPNNTSRTGFTANTEYEGLPYSSVKEKCKFVGFDVSLLTFMTAVNNKYSLLYTEDVQGGRSQSGYGFTYYGFGCGSYFGIVCNVFALHALGFDVPWNTGEFHYLADNGILEAAYDQSTNGLELMDLLWERGHGSLIDDIYKDFRGNFKQVYWNDSISPTPRSFVLTPSQFNDKLHNDGVVIYHYKELYKNIHYEPSPFVAVEDEVISSPYVYNNDICTYAGDCASFKLGEKVVLNYNLTDDANFSYNGIKIYKKTGDTYEQVGTTFSIDSSHKLDITSALNTAGQYKAVTTDGENDSAPTYFEVIDHNTAYTDAGDGNKKVAFSSSNGTPVYIEFVYGGNGTDYSGSHQATDYVAGQCCGTYKLTDTDLTNGYAIINPVALRDSQYQATDSSDSVGYRPFNSVAKGDVYVRVHFQGQYGRIIGNYVLTDLWNS